MAADPKICFSCARRKLAGKPKEACGDCALLNVDRWAELRASAARAAPAWAMTLWASTSIETLPARAASKGIRA